LYRASGDTGVVKLPRGPSRREALGFVKNPLSFLRETARQFGPISYFKVLNQRICLVDDPECIQDILVHRQHLFVRDTGATLLRELVGDGLLTRDEPGHRERRRVLQPAFHRAQIASYARAMVAETVRTSEEWGAGDEIDAVAEMKRLTLSIVGAALFGADFRQSATRMASVLQRVIDRSRLIAPGLALLEPAAHLYREVFPNGPSLFFGSERLELESILAPVIEARRRHSGEDMLSMLLSEFDDEDATNEIVTMVLAGHETTATALALSWYLIGKHPAVETAMAEELEATLGDRDPAFRRPAAPELYNERLQRGAASVPARPRIRTQTHGKHHNRGL
jgi:cytochrome P450